MKTPYGDSCQYNVSTDGKGKFKATLARIFLEGMSAHDNSRASLATVNPFKAGTQKAKAFDRGWLAAHELKKKTAENAQ